ncbi:MAG: FAD-dependent oxidoreductase [candidate division WOR-3 bacterium]
MSGERKAESGMRNAVLVLGGGIGGVQAALDLADTGYRVYLAERAPAIGGLMAMLDKTFPTNDCSMCILSPKLVGAARHPNIELLTLTELLEIQGEAGAFQVRLRRHARSVDLTRCTGCGDCLTRCPVRDIPNEFEGGLTFRRAIYRLYAQAVPNAPVIDRSRCLKFTQDRCGACQKACKAGAIDYTQKDSDVELTVGAVIVASGVSVARQNGPGIRPEFGYGRFSNVVTNIEFERILSASGPFSGHIQRPSDKQPPRRIAWIQCVGSRDEGLNLGYCSAMCCMAAVKEAVIAREHAPEIEPTIFYMDMRAYGKDFDRYVARAEQEYGVRFIRGRVAEVREIPQTRNLIVRFAPLDGSGSQLSAEFDMVVLSCGFVPACELATLAERLGIRLNRYSFVETSSWVPVATSRPGIAVVGPFAAPMAIPETVTLASASAALVQRWLASGVERPAECGMRSAECAERDVRGEPPRVGVFVCHCGVNIGAVVNVPSVVEFARTLPFVVYAEENLYSCSSDAQQRIREKILEHRLNRVVVASCSPRTHEPLFQATLVEAGLNPHLFTMANIRDQCSWVHMKEPEKATVKAKELVKMAVARAVRQKPLARLRLPVTRAGLVIGGGIAGMSAALALGDAGFDVFLVEKEQQLGGNARTIWRTLEGEDVQERLRELEERVRSHPRIRLFLGATIRSIEGFVGNYRTTVGLSDASDRSDRSDVLLEHGVVIVATGGRYRQPTEYHYGQSPAIVTQQELERLLRERSSLAALRSVVMIQCVGSREEGRNYCSRICCAEAIKNALALKELNPELGVFVLYRDIRTYGFREEFYRAARERGVVFIPFEPVAKPAVTVEDGRLEVKVRDPVLAEELTLLPDLLVLSAGVEAPEGARELAQMLKIPLHQDGFFLEAHMKLRPVDCATDGVFLAGMCHYPKFIDEAIAQAQAAAGRAATVLSRDHVEAEATVAHVNPERCSACHMCESLCAYRAIEVKVVDERTGRQAAVVNEALCKGCGACAANCRSLAIDVWGFAAENVQREIDALMSDERLAEAVSGE